MKIIKTLSLAVISVSLMGCGIEIEDQAISDDMTDSRNQTDEVTMEEISQEDHKFDPVISQIMRDIRIKEEAIGALSFVKEETEENENAKDQ